MRILATLLVPDAGRAAIAGHDVVAEPAAVREHIAVTGQYAALDDRLTGAENLVLFGRLGGLSSRAARARAAGLLGRFGLDDSAGRLAGTYSGGMRRRLDLAATMMIRRDVVFLDEPTTGLDPHSRSELHEVIRAFRTDGVTAVLTTQYLEEADLLADRVTVVAHGRVISEGTPAEIKARAGGQRIELVVADPAALRPAAGALAALGNGAVSAEPAGRRLSVPAPGGLADLARAVAALTAASIPASDLALRHPSLDDAFMALTGHAPRAPGEHPEPAAGGRR